MKTYRGEAVAPGVAVGPVRLTGFDQHGTHARRIAADQVEDELNHLRRALTVSREQLGEIRTEQAGRLKSEELGIFDAHIAYLADPMFVKEIEELVMEHRNTCESAIHQLIEKYDRIFELVESDALQRRAGDIRDVMMRVLRNLQEHDHSVPEGQPAAGRCILAARKLTTTDLFNLGDVEVDGIVIEEDGISAHAAILARSMGIPTISGIAELSAKLAPGAVVVVDAETGELKVDAADRDLAESTQAAERWRSLRAKAPDEHRKHITRDGVEVQLAAACGNEAEVELARTFGMDGVGLFRTELPFLQGGKPPAEEVLFAAYSRVVRTLGDAPVRFRLADLQSFHRVPGLPDASPRNPAMGLRGIRMLLHPAGQDLLRMQLRAILRAAAGSDNVGVLIPFVTGVDDVQRIKAALMEERLQLKKRDVPCSESVALAPIVEVPAAAYLLHAFLQESSYVVVALDDLQAHVLGADRDDPTVRDVYEMLHPALFELLKRMATEAEKRGKDLVLFGEAAADPVRLPFYLGLGIRNFAVAPVRLNGMLKTLDRFGTSECQAIAERVLEAPNAIAVQRVLVNLAD